MYCRQPNLEEITFEYYDIFSKIPPNNNAFEDIFDTLPPGLGSSPKRLKQCDTFGCYVATVLKGLPAQNATSVQRNILSMLKKEEKEAAASKILQSFYHFIVSPP